MNFSDLDGAAQQRTVLLRCNDSRVSYFAVTRKAGASTTTPTLVSRVTITQQIKSEFTTGTATGPVTPVLRTMVHLPLRQDPAGTGISPKVSRNLDHFRCSRNHRLCPYDYLCRCGGIQVGRTLHSLESTIKPDKLPECNSWSGFTGWLDFSVLHRFWILPPHI